MLNFYKNGLLAGNASGSGNIVPNSEALIIGARVDLEYRTFWNGTIDEVLIWNTTLSADEIKQHASRGLTNLSIYYSGSNDSATFTEWFKADNATLTQVGFSIADDSLIDVVEYMVVGKEIRDLGYSSIQKSSSSTTNSFPLNSLTSDKSKDIASTSFLRLGGSITNTTIPKNSLGGNIDLLRKSESLDTNTDSDSFDKEANLPLTIPFAAYSAEYPLLSSMRLTDLAMFSSSRNFGISDILLSTNKLGSVMQSSLDVLSGDRRIVFQNIFNGLSSSDKPNDITNQDPGAFESGLSVADFAVRDNVFVNFNSHNSNNDNAVFKPIENKFSEPYSVGYENNAQFGEWIEVRYLKEGDEIAVPDYPAGTIKWEKIASIKTLPEQHVYDLSIEGTRNFIANDIIAHNTARYFRYLAKFNTSSSNLTPILNDVTINYTGIFADNYGVYNYTFTAPSALGDYAIKVNATWAGTIPGENSINLRVRAATTINLAAGGAFEIRDGANNRLAVIDSTGTMNIRGTLAQNAEPTADANDFVVQNSSGGLNLVITNPEGHLRIKGSLAENQDSLSPTPSSFVIQNSTGTTIAYVNSTGGLFLRGSLLEEALFD